MPALAGAAVLPATPANFGAVFASAQAGDVIQLVPGDYGTFSGGQKPGLVTVLGAPGGTSTMSVSFTNASNVRVQGLTISGATVSGSSNNVAIAGSAITKPSLVDASSMANANVVFDGDTFDGIDACSTCYEGRLSVKGNNNSAPVGVAIVNSHFGNGGCSDGVQIIGNAYGVQVGPGNEFSGIKQASCSNHVDSIQLYGSSHTQIVGNYFHDNDTIIMAPDGGDHEVLTDNVMVGSAYSAAVQLGSQDTATFSHNTVRDISVRLGSKAGGQASTNGINNDNVMLRSGFSIDGSGCSCTFDHDLYSASGDSKGSAALVGMPAFTGGANPASYAGYLLAPGSPGRAAPATAATAASGWRPPPPRRRLPRRPRRRRSPRPGGPRG